MSNAKAYAGIARVPFLLLPITLIASGASAAAWAGGFSWLHAVVALVGLVALHAAVNSMNEASDMRTGIDLNTQRTPFSGGSGTLPSGALSIRRATVFSLSFAALGLAVGIWFVTRIGTGLIPIMVIGAVCVLGYTDFLARIGLGEIAAGAGLGLLPVMGAALVQEGVLPPAAIAAAIPAFLMTFNLLLLNEFPDEAADREGGRRNLVLLFGRRPAAVIYTAAAILTPASIIGAVIIKVLPPFALIAVLPSLLMLPKPIGWALSSPDQDVPIPALGGNVVWNLTTNLFMAIGLIVAVVAG
jgi:1,4-dihydroxy-2-naphthoate octaprenyltransferase